jgi:uncharacterized repeat protein (TIGR04138 family)
MSGIPVAEPVIETPVLDRLRARFPQYREPAYLFVLCALEHTIREVVHEPRHVTGAELAEGCRRLAIARFGPLSRSVLAYWGVHTTGDIGEVVFALVECGVLRANADDRLADFDDLFDFEEVFERDYPWAAPATLVD